VVVITKTDQGAEGHGMTFTLGRGNEIVKAAAESFKPFVLGKNIKEVCPN
jgi:L-fuconate dehydratase